MFVNRMKKNNHSFFMAMLFILSFVLLSIAVLSWYLFYRSDLVLYRLILEIIIILAVFANLYILIISIAIVKLLKGEKIFLVSRRCLKFSLKMIYPKLINLCQLFRFNKDKIRSVFSDLNNRLIFSSDIHVKPENILILVPHCLQKLNCPHKITSNIMNCKRCGACDVERLILLTEQYGVKLFVATGGTLARKIIKETQPRAIIAVACERDLSSGILDIKGIPVIGILNERPEGPCVNTKVDINEIEKAILYFIGEEK